MSLYSSASFTASFFKPFGMKLMKSDRLAALRSTIFVKRLTVKLIPFFWGRTRALHGNILAEFGRRLGISLKQ